MKPPNLGRDGDSLDECDARKEGSSLEPKRERCDADEPPSPQSDGDESAPPEVHEFIHEGEPQRLDTLLAERLPEHSRAFLQKLVDQGYVTVPKLRRDVKASTKISRGMSVRCHVPPPRKIDLSPKNIPFDLLYEDEFLAVIDKPAGLAVHPAPSQVGDTLVNALLYRLSNLSGVGGEERPGIVHRLDKETSGVLLVAKNDLAHRALAHQFKERLVHKTYLAISRGEPKEWEGSIDRPLGRSYTHSKKQMVRVDGTGREAITAYRVLERFRGYALIEVYPKTGRTHQIRVHLASLHLPIAADKLYGREKQIYLSDLRGQTRTQAEQPILSRHALHAASISFQHPLTQQEMAFSARLPQDMHALLKGVEQYRSHGKTT